MYGLWSEKNCECLCIQPYCTDLSGRCAAMFTCNPTNPWANCVRGVDCPWWKNTLKENSCATGPEIPNGVWEVWPTQKECCALYPQSEVCETLNKKEEENPPTPFPTIGAANLPDFEDVVVKFSGSNIPVDVSVVAFQKQLLDVLKIILLDLADEYNTLKILGLEYRSVDSRDDDLIYDIQVTRQDGITFGSIIRDSIRENISFIFRDMIDWLDLQGIADSDYIDLQFCFDWEDKSYCNTKAPTKVPTSRPTNQPEEVIPVEFLDIELPIVVSLAEFSNKMLQVVKNMISDLDERYNSLKVLEVELRNRRRTSGVKSLKYMSADSGNEDGTDGTGMLHRSLQREPFDLIYDITILKEPGVEFGPIIHEAIREGAEEFIMQEILSWIRTNHEVSGDSASLSFCVNLTEGYECFTGSRPTRRPTRRPTSNPIKEASPTRRPTPGPTQQATETLAVQFSNVKLPVSVNIVNFREKMRLVLKGILDDLADRYFTLNVLDIKYRDDRRTSKIDDEILGRNLQRVVDLTYDVTIRRQDGIDFESIFKDAIRASSEQVLIEVVEWMEDEGVNNGEDPLFEFCLDLDCFVFDTESYPTVAPGKPTRQPTNRPIPEFYFEEVVPIRFSVRRLPTKLKDQKKLRRELKDILESVLFSLAARYDFRVLKIAYRDVERVESRKIFAVNIRPPGVRGLQSGAASFSGDLDERLHHMMFDVTIAHRGDIDLEELIQQNYDVLIGEVRENPSGYESVTSSFDFEVCVESDTCSTDGRDEITYTYTDTFSESNNVSVSTFSSGEKEGNSGLPIWAIILIVLLVLLVCCMCCIGIGYCLHYRYQNSDVKEEVNNNVEVNTRRSSKSRRYSGESLDHSSDYSSNDGEDDSDERMTPQTMMPMRRFEPQQGPHQMRLIPTPQHNHYHQPPPSQQYPCIQNNIAQQGPPVITILNHSDQQTSCSSVYNGAGSVYDGDFSSAQYMSSIGGIETLTCTEFDNVSRPDPSMYSLFTTKTTKSQKTKKSKRTKRSQREPSVYTQDTEISKKTEPSFYIGYDGEDAPGFKSGNSVYFTEDGRSVQGNTGLLIYDHIDQESERESSIYSQLYAVSSNNFPRDPSFYTTAEDSQSTHQEFFFPDSNDIMSIISGGSELYGHLEYNQKAFSVSQSTKKTNEAKKSRKSSKSKKDLKSKARRSSQQTSHFSYSARSED